LIAQGEIEQKSYELGVHVSHVQRDYVFGWLLSGIYKPDNPLQNLLILKGGNCFRKAYFERTRYSNDLDFASQVRIEPNVLLQGLRQACTSAATHSGIEFLVDDSRVKELTRADSESRIFDARVYFKSFYGEEDFRLRVDIDVKEYDRIFLPVQSRRLIHSYSDAAQCNATIQCVQIEELLASKLRALLHRHHSPDLYDFVNAVFVQKVLDVSRKEILSTFLKQTIYEPDPQAAKALLLQLPFALLKGFWNEYLVCPKSNVITFEDAQSWFVRSVTDLFALAEPRYGYAGAGDWNRTRRYFGAEYRDAIIEAGRLQRVIRLGYDGLERVVEPYALVFKRKVGGDAREYFYGWTRSGGRSGPGIRAYTADKVQNIAVTEESFDPRYPIELAKAGDFFAKPFASGDRAPRSSSSRSFGRTSRSTTYGSQAYTIQCPVCDKRFKRAKYDTKLNAHEDRYGNRCYGRVGYMV
jgi:predicted nucleotidyltransferase component of viral defense system